MTNKASNQQDDIWGVIAKGLVEAVKMVFSIFVFVFTAGSSKSPEDHSGIDSDEEMCGHRRFGFYSKRMNDENDE